MRCERPGHLCSVQVCEGKIHPWQYRPTFKFTLKHHFFALDSPATIICLLLEMCVLVNSGSFLMKDQKTRQFSMHIAVGWRSTTYLYRHARHVNLPQLRNGMTEWTVEMIVSFYLFVTCHHHTAQPQLQNNGPGYRLYLLAMQQELILDIFPPVCLKIELLKHNQIYKICCTVYKL